MSDRILGVLGGMGPLVSAQFMTRLALLTPAERDQDHIPAVLWSDPRVPNRDEARLAGGADPLPWLIRGLSGLKEAGVGAVAIPCNVAYCWYEQMTAACSLPILHIVDAAAAELRRLEIPTGRVGLIATKATLSANLYQNRLDRQGWPCITPTDSEMEHLITPSIAAVKAKRMGDASGPLTEAMRSLHARGANAVVVACTEIPLALATGAPEALPVPLVDTIDGLARAAILWARG